MRGALAFAILLASGAASAEVFRCTQDGNTVYSDRACGPNAKAVAIAPDPNSPARGKLVPKAKIIVSNAVADECWEGYRRFARDPTTAKNLGHFAEVAEDGFPYMNVNAVFTNRVGGPERRFVRCKLNDDMTIDKTALDEAHTAFFRSQMGD